MQDMGGSSVLQHYWLTQGMARALGVNLCAAIAAGALKRSVLDDLVARCEACKRQAECLPWLGRNAMGAADLPEYCANRQALLALKPRVEAALRHG